MFESELTNDVDAWQKTIARAVAIAQRAHHGRRDYTPAEHQQVEKLLVAGEAAMGLSGIPREPDALLEYSRCDRRSSPSRRAANFAAAASMAGCNSSLVPMRPSNSSPATLGVLSRGVVELWKAADKMLLAAELDQVDQFEISYRRAIELAKALAPAYQDARSAFTQASSRPLRIHGRQFSSAHQCLFDLATGVVFAANAANKPEVFYSSIDKATGADYRELFPLQDWPTLRGAVATLDMADVDDVVVLAERECAIAINGGTTPSPASVAIGDDGGLLSASDLAKKYCLRPDSLRRRLERWRFSHDEGYSEVTNPVRNKPKYLYSEAAVLPVIRGMQGVD